MRNYTKIFYFVLFASALMMTSCKKKHSKSEKEKRTEELSQTWTVQTATAGGSDVTINGTLSFTFTTGGNYTVSSGFDSNFSAGTNSLNNSEVWKQSGTWAFESDNSLNKVILDGNSNNVINIVSISAGTLKISYNSAYPKAVDSPQEIVLDMVTQ